MWNLLPKNKICSHYEMRQNTRIFSQTYDMFNMYDCDLFLCACMSGHRIVNHLLHPCSSVRNPIWQFATDILCTDGQRLFYYNCAVIRRLHTYRCSTIYTCNFCALLTRLDEGAVGVELNSVHRVGYAYLWVVSIDMCYCGVSL